MFHRRPRRFNPAARPVSLRQGGPFSGPSSISEANPKSRDASNNPASLLRIARSVSRADHRARRDVKSLPCWVASPVRNDTRRVGPPSLHQHWSSVTTPPSGSSQRICTVDSSENSLSIASNEKCIHAGTHEGKNVTLGIKCGRLMTQ
jgi:hypothetical protein